MEWLVVVMVLVVSALCLALMGFLVWREGEHRKQIDELTSKIVAKTLGEYSAATKDVPPAPRPEKPERLIDGTLGKIY